LPHSFAQADLIFGFLRLSTIKKCPHILKLDHRELRNSKGHKMVNRVHCRALLRKLISDLDSYYQILDITIMTRSSRKGKGSEGKGERNCLDWTQNTRNTDWAIKWVIVCIAAYFCASLSQIWILEIEYSQKVSSHAQIGPLGAEKQQRT
jgi:hypothetical protein